MRLLRSALTFALLLCPLAAEVRVWQGTLTLPTYEEGLPDVNPPFDQFAAPRFQYPYTRRESISPRSVVRHWRALFLENEYLKCSVLPDIGGHLYSCTDKLSGREMFYANPSLKKANIGYRGAWSAFGVEFNFPVSHNWMSMSPVDFAHRANPDGSGSVIVANIDRPYGMQWRVELVLRPGSTVLEQRVTLYNRSRVRHRYYWWSNAGVEVWDDTRVWYPMRYTASHGFTFVDTWPVNKAGLDLSVIANHTAGPVSEFIHGSREPFMGLYHPRTRTGLAHYSDYAELPGKKLWTWGVDADGRDWRVALSDNRSAYAEVQAGLFRNQETYGFLPPNEDIRFTEYWIPVREIGGITRANLHGALHFYRERGALVAALNVNHTLPDARIRILAGSNVLYETRAALEPARVFSHSLAAAPAGKCTFELADERGAALLTHTEEAFDWTPAGEIQTGPQPPVKRGDDPLELGADLEANGDLPAAWDTYDKALKASPDNFGLNKAAGRLAVALKRYDEAVRLLSKAQWRTSNDPEIHYYLGAAFAASDENRKARTEWEGARRQPQFRHAALLELARLSSREGDRAGALELLRASLRERPGSVLAGGLEVALLRSLGQTEQARQRLAVWLAADPTAALLRHEAVLLGGDGEPLWKHLAADPERVLETATDYIEIGLWADALGLLARRYPAVDPQQAEPGAVLPQDYPLVAYYRGYCREKLGQSGAQDYRDASRLSTRYVFPNRPGTFPVLRRALEANPSDATARFLLGSLYMSGAMPDLALAEWQAARRLNPDLPVLHRNIARTLMSAKNDERGAAEVYREGLERDPGNLELYTGLTTALSLLRRPAAERVEILLRHPRQDALPTPMLFDLALSLAEAGRMEDAEKAFHGRFFAREEGAANVREIYIEVQLRKALALSGAGKAEEARRVIDGLGKEVPGLAFTREGLGAFQKGSRYQYMLGLIEERCGGTEAARRHWQSAAGQGGAFAVLAAKRLGLADWRERAEKELEAATEGGYSPGSRVVTRALLLRALGREDEALARFRKALLLPDVRLSHYLARAALLDQ